MRFIIFFISMCLIAAFCSCHSALEYKYEKLHDKYRTLWYRTGQKCFYDSSRKYGLLYFKEIGISADVNDIDTVTFSGITPNCNK